VIRVGGGDFWWALVNLAMDDEVSANMSGRRLNQRVLVQVEWLEVTVDPSTFSDPQTIT
jgi:hypothetical protein